MAFDKGKEIPHGERRRTIRSEVILPALILVGHQEKRTRTANVSLDGVRLQIDEPLPRDQKIRIGFLANSWPVEAEGRVIYSLKAGSGYISGLSFERISPVDRESLRKYLDLFEPPRSEGGPATFSELHVEKTKKLNTSTEIILPDSRASALLILKGDQRSEKTVYEISRGVTSIGRHEDNDIVLSDSSVSKHHAKIRFEDDGYFIYDFASTNGTRVNGRKVYRQRIKDSDIIEIAQSAFTFLTKKKPFQSSEHEGD
jgi:hypothetical protein